MKWLDHMQIVIQEMYFSVADPMQITLTIVVYKVLYEKY